MRNFKEKDFPEYYQVNWETAEHGTAIFIGRNVFLDPYGEIMSKEIDEFKEMAKYKGVLLTMRREFKTTINGDEVGHNNKDKDLHKLVGFWFYCVGTTPAHRRDKTKVHDEECTTTIIGLFKGYRIPMRIQSIIKDFGLTHSEPRIRASIKYLCSIGFLEEERIDAKSGHKGRPTAQYIPTDLLYAHQRFEDNSDNNPYIFS